MYKLDGHVIPDKQEYESGMFYEQTQDNMIMNTLKVRG